MSNEEHVNLKFPFKKEYESHEEKTHFHSFQKTQISETSYLFMISIVLGEKVPELDITPVEFWMLRKSMIVHIPVSLFIAPRMFIVY